MKRKGPMPEAVVIAQGLQRISLFRTGWRSKLGGALNPQMPGQIKKLKNQPNFSRNGFHLWKKCRRFGFDFLFRILKPFPLGDCF